MVWGRPGAVKQPVAWVVHPMGMPHFVNQYSAYIALGLLLAVLALFA